MKRLASAVAVSAVLVLTPVVLAGTASAQTFSNCTEAAAAGVDNIPASSPAYSADLDSDGDGVACEKDGAGSGSGSDGSTGSTSQDESVSSSGSSRPDQVTVVPEGGAETGDGSTETGSGWWVGGGLLAAAAGLLGARRSRSRV
ncbi:excalibur calcium-binding domain-containing protein [Actinomycetospora sp. NBRC 106378]|uniref:excalibur calcium-binding domain-containing protein n=1 Tax=Actinomycetospora sp. NBRC 106378 TaxID=3032208 RepID=UPI002554118E|nr:excalibur calcium-binding domain-containing protein [Actinomycetospora sp. NBRC 106378]